MNTDPSVNERAVRAKLMRGVSIYVESRTGRREALAMCDRWRSALSRNAGDLPAARAFARSVIVDARDFLDRVERMLANG